MNLGLARLISLVDVLHRDYTFYQTVCKETLSDCSIPYLSLDATQLALIRGGN
jgi:hypothetical protein